MRSRKRRNKAAPVLGAAGLLALAGTAYAKTPPATSTPVLLGEEEVSDVSLSTFHVFDREGGRIHLAAGGCGHGCGGGCGCGHGCGGGCHMGEDVTWADATLVAVVVVVVAAAAAVVFALALAAVA